MAVLAHPGRSAAARKKAIVAIARQLALDLWLLFTGQARAERVKDRFVRWETGDQHALFASARRYLGVVRTLVRRQIPFETPESRLRDATKAQYDASPRRNETE